MFRQKCPCLRPQEEEVQVLDYRHSSLDQVPAEVFNFERTLEELYVDANNIRDLPRELFYCHGLRVLSLGDNELISIPPAIASLLHLTHLDVSKNGIVDLPDNIKGCKYLTSIEASVNPIGKLPEGFTQLLNLTELYVNDTFMDYLPGSFGRLSKLRILECRENHLKTLPKSMSRLTCLERLDIGNNEFTEMPDVVGSLTGLLELWCDCNRITTLPTSIGNLKQLMFLDASKNRIEYLPGEIDGCVSLADLHLSTNLLQQLPENIGRLSNLTTLKVDDNRLTALPFSIGGLVSMSEMNISSNDLEELPPSIGFLRHLRTLYADENFIYEIPPELGSCNGLTVLSVRSNNLVYIPDEIGRIPRLRVLNLSDNKIRCLPFSLTRLKELQALWLAENQTKPLIRLQPDIDIDTGQRMLTCYLLPQMPEDREDLYSDAGSFHPSMWEEERRARQRIHFDFEEEEIDEGKLERQPTPYPKEMKHRIQHMRNLALKQLGIPGGKTPGSVVGRREMSVEDMAEAGPSTSVLLSDNPEEVTNTHTSPMLRERHLLLKADKEKQQKDKARMSKEEVSAKGASTSPRKGDRGSRQNTPQVARSANRESIGSRENMSAPAGQDEDDGGFLNTSNRSSRSHPGSRPGSQQIDEAQVPLLNKAPPVQVPHISSTATPGISVNNQPISNGVNLSRSTSNQGASATMPGVQNGSAPNQTGQGDKLHALSYTEFTRGLLSVTKNPPLPVTTGENMNLRLSGSGFIPSSFYLEHHESKDPRQRPPKARGGRGYESDTGYKSDTQVYRRKKHYNPDGYASDWEAVQRHHMSQKNLQRDGYSSDYDGYNRRRSANHELVHQSHRPNPSYRPSSQPNVSRSNSASQRSINSQRSGSHHSITSQRPASYGHSRPSSGGHQGSGAGQQPGGYTNVPSTKRTMLRNDEMYEMYPGARRGQNKNATNQPQSRSNNSLTASNTSITQRQNTTDPRQSNPSLVNAQRTPPSSRHAMSSQQNTPSRGYSANTPGNQSEDWNTPVSQQTTNLTKENSGGGGSSSTEDEIWRAQLYQASVKLQKTPSEKRKQRGDPSPNASHASDDVFVPGQPPPYQPAPPYDPTRSSRHNVNESGRTPGTPQTNRSSYHGLNATPERKRDPYSRPQQERPYPEGSRQGALRPTTLALGTPPASPGPARSAGPPRDAYYHTPQKTKNLTVSPSKPYEPQDKSHNTNNGASSRPYSNYGSSPNKPLHVQVDNSAGAAGVTAPPPLPDPPTHYSPIKLTQYDKDVALFKGPDPPSQVSSSTDSGYGHAHIYERVPGDTAGAYAGGRTPHGQHLYHQRASPSKDSALGSRESTPGGGSVSMSSQPRPAPEGQRNSDGCIDDSQLKVMEVTIIKNPGLGFSIAGGLGSPGNPFRDDDVGIFVTKVSPGGAAESKLISGDKLLRVNGVDFTHIDHKEAVKVLRSSSQTVSMLVERA